MGILGANLAVFQVYEYAYHFLQTCSHLLNVEATDDGVHLDDRFVHVSHCPLGIVPEQLNVARRDPEVAEWTEILQKKYEGKTLLVGAPDKLEGTRGMSELFFKQIPSCFSSKFIQADKWLQGRRSSPTNASSTTIHHGKKRSVLEVSS